jgi:hypothetical protein
LRRRPDDDDDDDDTTPARPAPTDEREQEAGSPLGRFVTKTASEWLHDLGPCP